MGTSTPDLVGGGGGGGGGAGRLRVRSTVSAPALDGTATISGKLFQG